jgi:acyl carrier protein
VTVHGYMRGRLEALGKSLNGLHFSTDVVRERVLDSLALTGLIAAVEHATGREIDFLEVDPDALGTIEEIVDELTRVLEGAVGR